MDEIQDEGMNYHRTIIGLDERTDERHDERTDERQDEGQDERMVET